MSQEKLNEMWEKAFEGFSNEILRNKKDTFEPEESEGPDFEGEFEFNRDQPTQKFEDVFGLQSCSGVNHDVTMFSPDDWDRSVQGHIPEVNEMYKFPAEALEDLVLAVEVGDKVNIVGPTGSGKTTLVEQFCARTNRPFFRFNGRGDMEAGPILGMMHVRDQETVWEDGVFTEAVKKGATVLFDEWTVTPPEINMSLQSLLEENGSLVLTDMPGDYQDKRVTPDPRFTLICADNTGGLGDMRGAFSGTNVQNTATLDRFFTTINLDYLDEDHEKEIIHKKHPELTDEYIGKMVQFANLIRTSYNQEELDHTMSPRTLLNWAKKTLMYQDRDRALKVSFLKKFNDDAQISCIQNHYFTIFGRNIK